MGLTVYINNVAEIDEWIEKYKEFSFLKNIVIPQDDNHKWHINAKHLGYTDKTAYNLQIMFIGKTGYGKSTTLNRLIGKNVFETSDVSVCTKELYTGIYRINKTIPTFLMVSDLPGIGESNNADNHYFEWYKEMLDVSQVVVYLLRADQRDFAVDEVVFKKLFKDTFIKKKVLIALNYADKVEPISRKEKLSTKQILNLNQKIEDVSRIF